MPPRKDGTSVLAGGILSDAIVNWLAAFTTGTCTAFVAPLEQ
ncbi:MAG: hypothetical protein ABIN97_18615 [Ginsengibacter sp.]